mmetsp:Transcript_46485/g.83087  ORF Transcript_46485/g.83087 Transcript_46485/m.83087 type:complete len:259 (-) Transcript_46485:94-870(-)
MACLTSLPSCCASRHEHLFASEHTFMQDPALKTHMFNPCATRTRTRLMLPAAAVVLCLLGWWATQPLMGTSVWAQVATKAPSHAGPSYVAPAQLARLRGAHMFAMARNSDSAARDLDLDVQVSRGFESQRQTMGMEDTSPHIEPNPVFEPRLDMGPAFIFVLFGVGLVQLLYRQRKAADAGAKKKAALKRVRLLKAKQMDGTATAQDLREAELAVMEAQAEEDQALTIGMIGGTAARIRRPLPLGTPLSEMEDDDLPR